MGHGAAGGGFSPLHGGNIPVLSVLAPSLPFKKPRLHSCYGHSLFISVACSRRGPAVPPCDCAAAWRRLRCCAARRQPPGPPRPPPPSPPSLCAPPAPGGGMLPDTAPPGRPVWEKRPVAVAVMVCGVCVCVCGGGPLPPGHGEWQQPPGSTRHRPPKGTRGPLQGSGGTGSGHGAAPGWEGARGGSSTPVPSAPSGKLQPPAPPFFPFCRAHASLAGYF